MAETELETLECIDIMQMMQLMPHRYPFLLVDRIIEIDGDNSAIGIKNVTINEPFFQGHFPAQPIMPGVLLIEGMAQTAGAICQLSQPDRPASSVVYFMTIDKAKFRKPVQPGDRIEYHVNKLRNRGAMWKFRAVAMVDGAKVAEAEIGAMLGGE